MVLMYRRSVVLWSRRPLQLYQNRMRLAARLLITKRAGARK